ncbi:MAG: tetratricopeptide repeat protein [Candidatus Omnitrophica bacterium]|nr:tetratricopeptide repeat protein [Candidatus Omnitrophota bacterium]
MGTLRIISIFLAVLFLSSSLIPLPQGHCQEDGSLNKDAGEENAAESSFVEETVEEFRKKKVSAEDQCAEDVLLKDANAQLKEKIVLLENSFKEERAKFYQELGTAYTKAKFFDLAIESYLQSLVFNPSNAKVYYNLGLLYKSAKDDVQKSLFYFKKYLRLKPDAENRQDVEYMIKMLEPDPGNR